MKASTYQFWALLCRCHSCKAREKRKKRHKRRVTNGVCSPFSDKWVKKRKRQMTKKKKNADSQKIVLI